MSGSFSFSSLNPAQREAVNVICGPVLILAGAGTGKTRTVTCRIANMLHQGIEAKNILAVTFTNKAAVEMRHRIGGMISKSAVEEMTVCTFHSLCVRILREGIENLGYKKNFSIYSGSDQIGLIKQLIIRKGGKELNIEARNVLSLISNNKNSGRDPADQEDDFVAEIARAYTKELKAQNALDFDDLLVFAEKLLREYKEVKLTLQELYTHITVDEFQDTNSLQMQLLQQLVGAPYNICVVGDDDQSIYGWRGADVTNILQFERHFPNPKVILLEENYRSSEAIIHTSNSLIRHNLGRREKVLRAAKKEGKEIRLISMSGDEEEAAFIAEEIHERNAVEKLPWESFCVLFRTNQQSRNLEAAMREMNIPYRVIGAQSFFDKKEVRDVLAYLEVLNDPFSDVPLLRIMNAPARGIGQNTAIQLTETSRERDCSLWEAMGVKAVLEALPTRAKNAVESFVDLIFNYHERMKNLQGKELSEAFKEFLNEIGYEEWMNRGCKTEGEKQQRSEGIYDIATRLEEITGKKTLRRFIDQMSLQKDQNDDIEKQKGVCMITLHASKGLEFPYVYLVGLENGILPHKRSIEEGNCDEERRLLYVGITRAQDELTMTYCSTRKRYNDTVHCEPSQFIKELDFKYIREIDYEEIMGAEATEEDLDKFFTNMRDILSEKKE